MTKINKWDSFVKEISNLIFFWIYGIVFFAIFRAVFIAIYNKELGDNVPIIEYWKTFQMGFKFDCTAVAYFLLIPLVCTLLLSYFNYFDIIRRVRIVCQYLFVILSTIICVITLNYYLEYNQQFNNFVFLGIYDDQKAIFETIIDYYHPILNTIAIIIVSTISLVLFRKLETGLIIYKQLIKITQTPGKLVFILLIVGLFICSLRGAMFSKNASRKWAAVTTSNFLNKTIINPYRSFKYAYEDYKELTYIDGKNPFGENLCETYPNQRAVSEIIVKKTSGNMIEKPKQIFMIIMESYDSWPLLDKYASFGIANNLREIASKGTHFTNFLPAYAATFYAYSTISSSVPYCGINTSQIATTHEPYISSIFTQFKELGYKTNMFYGGFMTWSNLGPFTDRLGCDAMYSGANIEDKSVVSPWGAEDEELFDLILKHVDPNEYTFNLVLTSSYHTPFPIDVYSKGFKYKSIEDLPTEAQQYYSSAMTFVEMGHLWYGDWAIGRFMADAEQRYPDALYGFTGDHYGRQFINHSPNLYETSSVPFILYGKNIPVQRLNTPGGHDDILPTLIELIAPEDFIYYSFGTSMFDENKEIGIGFEKVIDRDSLFYSPKDAPIRSIGLKDFGEKEIKKMKYEKQYNDHMKLAWHYTVKGDSLKLNQND